MAIILCCEEIIDAVSTHAESIKFGVRPISAKNESSFISLRNRHLYLESKVAKICVACNAREVKACLKEACVVGTPCEGAATAALRQVLIPTTPRIAS